MTVRKRMETIHGGRCTVTGGNIERETVDVIYSAPYQSEVLKFSDLRDDNVEIVEQIKLVENGNY